MVSKPGFGAIGESMGGLRYVTGFPHWLPVNNQVMETWVTSQDMDAVLRIMNAAEVPASPIYSVADIFRDPHFLAREMIESVCLSGGKHLKILGIVPKLGEKPGSNEWICPSLRAHMGEVLAQLGFNTDEIRRLHEIGAV